MKTSIVALFAIAAAASVFAQNHRSNRSSGHTSATHQVTRGAGSGSASSHQTKNTGGRTTSPRQATRSSGWSTGQRSTTSHRTGSHSGHRRTGAGHVAVSATSMRPGGTGHPRDWFEHQRWHEGPAWVTPVYSCYAGFVFSAEPAQAILVWVFDNATGQYYEAYYYPQYGYYAWLSNPLVAVAEYSPSISIVIQ